MLVFDPGQYALSLYALPTAVTTVLVLVLGIAVLAQEWRSPVGLVFFCVTLAIGIWQFAFSFMYCATSPAVALQWAKLAYLGVPFIPVAIFHFTVAVLRRYARYQRAIWLAWITSAACAAAILNTDLLVAGVYRYWWGYYPRYGWLSAPYLIYFFGLMIFSLRLFWVEHWQTIPATTHWHRTRALLIAFSIVYLGSFDYVAKYGVAFYPFGYIPVCVFVVLLARVLWRYRFVDITPELAAKQIINTMVNPLLVLDREGSIRIVNTASCQLFGKPEEALVGHPVTAAHPAFLSPDDLHALLKQDRVHDYELMLPLTPQGTRVVSLSASVMRDQRQEPMATVCILTDVTERKRAEQELQRAHGELTQSHEELKSAHLQLIQAAKMESVGRLAAGVAHEVKNPLAVILQGVDYLSRRINGDGDAAMVLRHTANAVRRADSVIRGLLDFSTSRELELSLEDLNSIVEQALLLVKHELDRSHIALLKRWSERLPRVYVDRHKMEQVFVNLIMNALQAMPEGGTLTIRTSTKRLAAVGHDVGQREQDRFKIGETVVIAEIEDTGPGIPEKFLEKVFDPFFTTKPTGKGTGLGLTVTKKIVELHEGMIGVENRAEGGVRVTLTLKAKPGQGNER